MYLLIGKGQNVQKGHIGAKIELTEAFLSKYMSLIVFLNLRCSVTDATVSGKRFQLLTTLHAKLFRLLRILPA